jgi:hypothetical protein
VCIVAFFFRDDFLRDAERRGTSHQMGSLPLETRERRYSAYTTLSLSSSRESCTV